MEQRSLFDGAPAEPVPVPQEHALPLTFAQAPVEIIQEPVTMDGLLFGTDLFGNPLEQLRSGKLMERYVIPPFSVLDARSGFWRERKQAWLGLGIKSETGRNSALLTNSITYSIPDFYTQKEILEAELGKSLSKREAEEIFYKRGFYKKEDAESTSIFDPVLCELAYSWFCPPGGTILDPFAGGSVRGVVASVLGFSYTGIDLRSEQVEANKEQAREICKDIERPEWIAGDSMDVEELVHERQFDFIFSCPPYFDLEKYSENPLDISNMTYEGFSKNYGSIIGASSRLLRDNRFACFVITNVRDNDGSIRNLVGLTIQAFQDAGLKFYNEAVLVTPAGSLSMRTSYFFPVGRKLGKLHQDVLIFYKGSDHKKIREIFPQAKK